MTLVTYPALLAAIYNDTPELTVKNNRGLAVRALRLNRTASAEPADVLLTRSVFDAAGFAQSATDPRLGAVTGPEAQSDAKPNFRYHNGLDGQVLQTDSADNGETTVFLDIERRVIWQRDGRGTVTTFSYDALGRASEIHQQMAVTVQPR
jgi:insecticidal toxin complex protein TccC